MCPLFMHTAHTSPSSLTCLRTYPPLVPTHRRLFTGAAVAKLQGQVKLLREQHRKLQVRLCAHCMAVCLLPGLSSSILTSG
jgi:hypothetical protein